MKRQFKFTKRLLDALPPCPADAKSNEVEYSDTDVAGLRIVINRLGRRYFMLRYTVDIKKRSMKLGDYPAMDINMARERAQELRTLIAKGIDPQVIVAVLAPPRGLTLTEFFEVDFLPYNKVANRSWRDSLSRWRHHLQPVFGDVVMSEIKTQDVQRFHDQKRAELCAATANRILQLLKRAANLAILWGKLEKNPVRGVKMHQENNLRHRFLAGDELRRFLAALDHEPNRTAAMLFKFLLATGVRRSEGLTARWRDVELEDGRWRLPMTKNGHSRFVVLNATALQLLHHQRSVTTGEFVFPAADGKPGHLSDPSKAFKRVCKSAQLDGSGLVIHSLRHSYASQLAQANFSLQVVQSLLGHRQISTTARYAHLSAQQLQDAAGCVSSAMDAAMT